MEFVCIQGLWSQVQIKILDANQVNTLIKLTSNARNVIGPALPAVANLHLIAYLVLEGDI